VQLVASDVPADDDEKRTHQLLTNSLKPHSVSTIRIQLWLSY